MSNSNSSSITEQLEAFLVAGQYYKLKRFPVTEAPNVAYYASLVLSEGWANLKTKEALLRDFASLKMSEDSSGLMANISMLFGVYAIRDLFFGFLTRVLYHTNAEGTEKGPNVTLAELEDGDVFPMMHFVELVLRVAFHPDMQMYKEAIVQGSKIPFVQIFQDAAKNATQEEMTTTNSSNPQS